MKINLYLPDDKKELYERVKRKLEEEGRSLSQLFLEVLEKYDKENIGTENIEDGIKKYFLDIGAELHEKLFIEKGDYFDFLIEADIDGLLEPLAVVKIKRVPFTKEILKKKPLRTSFFNHEEVVQKYIKLLFKKKIPLLILFYIGKDNSILKVSVLNFFSFSKKDYSPFTKRKQNLKDFLKKAIKEAISNRKKLRKDDLHVHFDF